MTTPRTLQTLLILMLSASLLVGAACSAEKTVAAQTNTTAPSLTIELQQGQLRPASVPPSAGTEAPTAPPSTRPACGIWPANTV